MIENKPGKRPGANYMVLSYLPQAALTSKNVVCRGFYCVADANIGLHPVALRCTMPNPQERGITIFISHER